MTSIIRMTPLSGGGGTEGGELSPHCYLLNVDGFHILLDCGWDSKFTMTYIQAKLDWIRLNIYITFRYTKETIHFWSDFLKISDRNILLYLGFTFLLLKGKKYSFLKTKVGHNWMSSRCLNLKEEILNLMQKKYD